MERATGVPGGRGHQYAIVRIRHPRSVAIPPAMKQAQGRRGEQQVPKEKQILM